MKTADRTEVMATIGPVTSSMALRAASFGVSPSAMWRSTFSTTTIASSTTMPIERTRPKRDKVFSEKPNIYMSANVPTKETGTATRGMIDARQVWRNSTTTMTTSTTASSSVMTTASRDAFTNTVGS